MQGVIDEVELEKQIYTELEKVEISEDFYNWAVVALKYMHGDEMATQEEVIDRLHQNTSGLKNRLDELVVMRADREISSEQFTKMSKEAEDELHDVEQEQKRLHSRMKEWAASANKYLSFAERICVRFNDFGNQEKREALETLGSTLELLDKKLLVVAPNELIGFKNVYKKLGKDLGRFDTKKALDIQELSKQKRQVFDVLCAEMEMVRQFCMNT